MEDDLPLKPDTSWGTEVRRMMRERSLTFDEACAIVLKEYLNRGHGAPLVDLVLRGGAEPGEAARAIIAPMISWSAEAAPEAGIRYRFGFEERRAVGRPTVRKSSDADPQKSEVLRTLAIGAVLLEEGRRPNWRFWHYLTRAMNEEGQWKPDLHFPIKARLFRTDGTRGREKEPELEIRSWVLASFVQARIDGGDPYDAAITLAHEELIQMGKAEGRTKEIGWKTVKDAYDAHAKAKRNK